MLRSNTFTVGLRAAEKLNSRIKQKLSGTFIERSAKYLKNVYVDYKEVAIQVRSEIKTKPLKATCIFSGMGVLFYSMSHNPDGSSFRAKFMKCANDVSLVSLPLVNPGAIQHLKLIQTCYNQDLIRYTSFGAFSIIWVDKYSDQCNMYETNCSYLELPYRKVASQIIDVGFLNIWWVISRKMLNYDVND